MAFNRRSSAGVITDDDDAAFRDEEPDVDVASPLNARDDDGWGEASAEEGATTTGPRLVKPDEDDHDDDHDDAAAMRVHGCDSRG